MKEGRGSRTAERVAERRAAHQLLDRPVVFEDPLALKIIDPEAAERIRSDPRSENNSPIAPFLRAAFAARSRFAEDSLRRAVENGVSQYIVLGAGLDTFAYRNPFANLRVFEVDHPATQSMKQRRLADGGIPIPPNLQFVPVDFETTRLADALDAAGFQRNQPAFCSWLGVVPYLERAAIEETLRYIASLPAGSGVAFDYGAQPSSLSIRGRFVFELMSARVRALGEPWKTFFAPKDLDALLHAAGFSLVEDFGPDELNRMYFANRSDGLRIGEMMRIAKAVV